ncbi:MAG TPA: ABC-type transport auxiliary lipoprotein family protein [Kofleriaceae bacterium]|nr:ABC-type transport auxiliary lipoprotein family protein [Kofleriaceae bacterium]
MIRLIAIIALASAACGGKVTETRYYQLAQADAKPKAGSEILVLETLATDAAYDDDRIVYRTTPFRLDYYHYHRWTSTPGVMVGNFLEQALETSGTFRAVVRERTPDAPAVLTGRVIAIEEVDHSRTEWLGRIAIELVLSDAHTGAILWTERIDESEPLRQQNPEGLAQALSIAMSRIVAHAVPAIASAIRAMPEEHPATVSRSR